MLWTRSGRSCQKNKCVFTRLSGKGFGAVDVRVCSSFFLCENLSEYQASQNKAHNHPGSSFSGNAITGKLQREDNATPWTNGGVHPEGALSVEYATMSAYIQTGSSSGETSSSKRSFLYIAAAASFSPPIPSSARALIFFSFKIIFSSIQKYLTIIPINAIKQHIPMPRKDRPIRTPDICCIFNNRLQVCSRVSVLSRIMAAVKKQRKAKRKIMQSIVKIIIDIVLLFLWEIF